MGEEYGETAPFPYFVDHASPELREAVVRGRADELREFGWPGEPVDPLSPETFAGAVLDPARRHAPEAAPLLALYRTLLGLRGAIPALSSTAAHRDVRGFPSARSVALVRGHGHSRALVLLNFGDAAAHLEVALRDGLWTRVLDTAEDRWGGPGASTPDELVVVDGSARIAVSPWTAVLYRSDDAHPPPA